MLDSWAVKERPARLVPHNSPAMIPPVLVKIRQPLQERPITRPTTAARRSLGRPRSAASSDNGSLSPVSRLSRSTSAASSSGGPHYSGSPSRTIIDASPGSPPQPGLIAVPKSLRPSLQSAYSPFKRGSLSRSSVARGPPQTPAVIWSRSSGR